jgi:tripartite-type tricarboxylate transporter receptor subunit TctC
MARPGRRRIVTRFTRRALAACAGVGLALAAPSLPAFAQDYPARQVTLVVPYPAGGGTDILARRLGQRLADRLGKPVVIENRAGGGTVIAANAVARSAADGYTLLVAPSGMLTINPTLYRQLPYDAIKDFAPIALITNVPFVLVIHPGLPAKSVTEFVAHAKARPGQLSYASPGTGTMGHLAAEYLKSLTGIEMPAVPYKGNMPALTDVVAGHVHLTFTDPAISPPLIREGKVRALGVTSLMRAAAVPDVPPLAEAGLPGFEAVSWHMIVAPAGTPQAVVDKLRAEIKAVVASPEMRKQIAEIGLIPVDTPPADELRRFIAAESERWGALVRKLGIAGSE